MNRRFTLQTQTKPSEEDCQFCLSVSTDLFPLN